MSFSNLIRISPVLLRTINRNNIFKNEIRHFKTSPNLQVGAYDGHGQTTVTILNNIFDRGLLIDTVNQFGFRLNSGSQVIGPLAIFNKSVFSWNISSDLDINEESLSLFLHLDPKLDVLVIGLSDFEANHIQVFKQIKELKKLCNIELLPTEKAIATFNYLATEGRILGGALIPPKKITFTEEDSLATKARQEDLYKVEFDLRFF